MEELGKILPALWKRRLLRASPHLADILASLWPQVVGKPLAQHCQPLTLTNGRLTIATTDSGWATQLRHMAEELRAEINSFLGSPAVKTLTIKYVPSRPPIRLPSPPAGASVDIASSLLPDASPSKLEPELARIVARSCAKYFARQGKVN